VSNTGEPNSNENNIHIGVTTLAVVLKSRDSGLKI